jgi:diguanylate cyclase (GGDEF)-like protein
MNDVKEMTEKTVPVSVDEIRNLLIDRLWFGTFIIAIFGVPTSVLRYITTGWLPLYNIHIILGLFVVTTYLLRNIIPYFYKSLFLVVLYFLVGISGIFTLGHLGAGVWWLIMTAFLVSSLYSLKAGIITLLIATILVITAGYLFINGILSINFDVNIYLKDKTSWISLLIAASLMPFIVLQALASYQHATMALLNQVDQQKSLIHEMATHDQLTGLAILSQANENLLLAIKKAEISGNKVAIFFVDLDNFKAVNDDYGHDAGDEVLKEVAQRMLTHIKNKDTASRIGGDEFVLIFPEIDHLESVKIKAQNLIDEISKPYKYDDHTIYIGASIGISLYSDNGNDPKSLRILADKAMYTVKESGKKGYAFAK